MFQWLRRKPIGSASVDLSTLDLSWLGADQDDQDEFHKSPDWALMTSDRITWDERGRLTF